MHFLFCVSVYFKHCAPDLFCVRVYFKPCAPDLFCVRVYFKPCAPDFFCVSVFFKPCAPDLFCVRVYFKPWLQQICMKHAFTFELLPLVLYTSVFQPFLHHGPLYAIKKFWGTPNKIL